MRDTNNKLDIDEQAEAFHNSGYKYLTFGEFLSIKQDKEDHEKGRMIYEIRQRLIKANIRIGGPDNDRILSSC
jgi:hypothetical protein